MNLDEDVGMSAQRPKSGNAFVRNESLSVARLATMEADESDHRRELAAAALRAEAAERSRIAAAMHDDTVQVLVAILAQLDRLEPLAKRLDDAEATALIDNARAVVREATDRTRRLAFELWPVTLCDRGLAEPVRTLVEQAGLEIGARVSISVTTDRFAWDVEQVVYRTIQEAVANIRKHSRADHIIVDVRRVNGWIMAVVDDDGCGFDASAADKCDGIPHMGLRTMVDRLHGSGGTIRVRSSQGGGTRVAFRLPISTECSA